jgi:retinol dehydrogenase 12
MKTIVVTGATGSVGSATVRELAKNEPITLVLVGRNTQKLEALKKEVANNKVRVDIITADLGNTQSVKKAAKTIRESYGNINAVINIAAVYKAGRVLTEQKYEMMMATNHLGPFALTTGIMDVLKATPGSKVFTVSAPSSTKLDFENLNGEKKFSALGAFGGSKMMNLLFAFDLAKKFEGHDHASIAFHPGLVKSELLNEGPALLKGFLNLISSKPGKTARAITKLVMEGDPRNQNGKFYNNSFKEMKAAKYAYDPSVQQQLWTKSEAMLAN